MIVRVYSLNVTKFNKKYYFRSIIIMTSAQHSHYAPGNNYIYILPGKNLIPAYLSDVDLVVDDTGRGGGRGNAAGMILVSFNGSRSMSFCT